MAPKINKLQINFTRVFKSNLGAVALIMAEICVLTQTNRLVNRQSSVDGAIDPEQEYIYIMRSATSFSVS